jgi:very-short-patch-repair endonuclease
MPVKNIIPGQRVTKEKLERARELRREMTPAEKLLWQQVRAKKLGVRFRRHTCPGGRCQGQIIAGFIVDFYCHRAELVVEVDGDIHDLQQEEDARREKVLTDMGLRIVRFRNDEILSNLPVVVHKLRELVQFENLIRQERQQIKEVGLSPKILHQPSPGRGVVNEDRFGLEGGNR